MDKSMNKISFKNGIIGCVVFVIIQILFVISCALQWPLWLIIGLLIENVTNGIVLMFLAMNKLVANYGE
jgi:hypothetical protein